jgi:protein TonB
MFSNNKQVLPALLLSLLIHALAFSVWPHMQAASIKSMVHGELIAPVIEEPSPPQPSAKIESESSPVPRKAPVLHPQHNEPTPAPQKAPDARIALPLLAEKADAASVGANDYVVPEAPPLVPGDKLPMASKPAEMPLKQPAPVSEPSSEKGKTASESGDGEDPVDRVVLAEYGKGIWERASKSGSYPSLALQRGWEGVVKVLVRHARSGVAYQISVKESSGYKLLDEKAVEMVKTACAHYELPDTLAHKAFSAVVPIEFKLI